MDVTEYSRWITKAKRRDLKRVLGIKFLTFKRRNVLIKEITNKISS